VQGPGADDQADPGLMTDGVEIPDAPHGDQSLGPEDSLFHQDGERDAAPDDLHAFAGLGELIAGLLQGGGFEDFQGDHPVHPFST